MALVLAGQSIGSRSVPTLSVRGEGWREIPGVEHGREDGKEVRESGCSAGFGSSGRGLDPRCLAPFE